MNKRKIRKGLLGLLTLSVFAITSLQTAFCAQDYTPCDVMLPVSVQTEGKNIPESLEYQIVLEGIENEKTSEKPPMPRENEITVSDGDQYEFGPILYTAPGIYRYSIYQAAGDENYVIYDNTKYTIVVQVEVVEDSVDGAIWLVPQIFGYSNTNTCEKVRELSFENVYDAPTAAETTAAEKTVPETTRRGDGGSSDGGGSGGGSSDSGGPSGTKPAETESAPKKSETQENIPEVTQSGVPDKPVYPELPDIPLNPDGTPNIPQGTEVEIYDLMNPSTPVYKGPYDSDHMNLPAGDYEIVVLNDEGVPLFSWVFVIGEDGVPRSMMLPKTGDTSIPFVLLALLMTASAAGMTILVVRIRKNKDQGQ